MSPEPAGAAEVVLVLPPDPEAVSGGNLYNRGLREGLTALGAPCRAAEFEEALALAVGGRPSVFLVDSLLREGVPELAARKAPEQRLVVLAHLLPGMAAPLGAEDLEREREILAGADAFLATGEEGAAALAPLAGGRPVHVLPPALAFDPPEPLPLPPAAADGFRGLVVGHLVPLKGLLPLLEELAALLAPENPLTLDVLGREDLDPAHARACRAFVQGHPRLRRAVRLRGVVPPEEMPAWYARASALVSPSLFESFGMALQEARACGLPILALDRPFARRHVQAGAQCRLHPTPRHLAQGCLHLVRDPAALGRLRQAARTARHPAPWTWRDAASALLTALRR